MTTNSTVSRPPENQKPPISAEEVVRLYASGYSQNDIVSSYDISLFLTRKILKEAGYDTSLLRTLDEFTRELVIFLAKSGIHYRAIEQVTDIHYHAIRDYVYKNDLGKEEPHVPQKPRFTRLRSPSQSVLTQFVHQYRAGVCFSTLAETFKLTRINALSVFYVLTDADIAAHRKALSEALIADQRNGISLTGSAKKHGCSRAVAQRLLQDAG